MNLTNEQWELYLEKYGKLLRKISWMISGDAMIANAEDNYSDLCIGALESISGFHKKTGLSFDEMINSEMFDKYTKTCLWTAKARKGIMLSERMLFRNKHISFSEMEGEDDSVFDVSDVSSVSRQSNNIFLNDLINTHDYHVKKVLTELREDPTLITETNRIKLKSLSKRTGVSMERLEQILKYLKLQENSA